MNISLLERDEIDKVKWNSCVHYATNGNIFGYLWYLDAMSRDWVGLVADDYETVMPLTKKTLMLGRQGLRQPELIRELAIYSINPPNNKRIAAFWEAIPEVYKLIDLQVDTFSAPADKSFTQQVYTNYYLPLAKSYDDIRAKYDVLLQSQLEIAENANLYPTSSLKPEKIAELYRQHNGPIPEQVFHGLQRIMYNVLHRGWGFASGVMNDQQKLLAADFFLFSHGRVMSIAPIVTKAGKAVYAQEHLYDTFVRTQAGKPQALDFNTVNGAFAEGFGALSYEYFGVKRDKRKWGVF